MFPIRIIMKYLPTLLCLTMLISSCSLKNNYFKADDMTYDIMDNLLYEQEQMDLYIDKEVKSGKHTIDKPLVIQNPYLVSPLTALIIFQSDEETSIEATINDKFNITFEKSTEHILPIYGLYDDASNKIVIEDEHGNINTIEIETDEYRGGVINVEQCSQELKDQLYLVSPDYERTSVYDGQGKLLWYLDMPDNEGAVVFLDNGHFLISDPFQGIGGIRINYASFVEMDYLGKIYKIYMSEYGYHHEIIPINNGEYYLIPGHDDDSLFMQGILYTIDSKSAEVINKIDFYDVFMNIAPEWTKGLTLDKKFNFVINGTDYDEESGDAIISVRSLGMLIRINMESKQIKWIFADPEKLPKEFNQYLLTPADGTRYPYGQHEPVFLEDDLISYHNNDIDFMSSDLSLSALKGHYSSDEILKIDEKNMTASNVWMFDGNKKILSRMSGSFEILENGHKLISYGSAVKEKYFEGDENINVGDFSYTEALMMELDNDDQIIWRATFPSVIHKVYVTSLYKDDIIPNLATDRYALLDGQDTDKHLGEKYDIKEIAQLLKNAELFNGNFFIGMNRAVIKDGYDDADEVKLLFIDEKEEGTIFTFKQKGEAIPIVNSGRYGIRINGLKGKQKVYILISDKWYDSGQIYIFE